MDRLVELSALPLNPPVPRPAGRRHLWVERSLKALTTLAGRGKDGMELRLYLRIAGALRAIALHVLNHTGLRSELDRWRRPESLDAYDPHLLYTYLQFAAKQDVLLRQGETFRLNPLYEAPAGDYAGVLKDLSGPNWRATLETVERDPHQASLRDLAFIQILARMAGGETLDPLLLRRLRVRGLWARMVANGEFEYQIMLCRYVLELLEVNLHTKIRFSGDEEFYTDLGRRAFRLYTRDAFRHVIEELVKSTEIRRVLDVGCGYGDYLEALRDQPGLTNIVGIERQAEVAATTAERFANDSRVQILDRDVLDTSFDEEYDLILINYVLFYFTPEDKQKLYRRLADLLAPGGRLLVCQYFPDLENLRRDLARRRGDLVLKRRIEMYFGDKVLYAEILLNETLDDFRRAERWKPFVDQAAEADLMVRRVAPADHFYYSLFIELTHTPT